MTDLKNAKSILASGSYTCAVCLGDKIYTSKLRGVKPLVSWYSQGLSFTGFSAADKVVGRATAFLYALLGVKAVYAAVISRPALEILEAYGIKAEYGAVVDAIQNRTGDGICPFEAAVMGIDDKALAYGAICEKMLKMGITLE